MKQTLDETQQTAILNALKKASGHPVWQKSNFLRVIGKQLQKIQDNFQSLLIPQQTTNQAFSDTLQKAVSEHTKDLKIYIALYSAKGSELNSWEHILLNLPNQLTARQIYLEEKNVLACIHAKPNPNNEAYICVTISADHIVELPPDKIPTDKLKQPLLTLKGRPLSAGYEGLFLHKGIRYVFSEGKLKKLDAEPIAN